MFSSVLCHFCLSFGSHLSLCLPQSSMQGIQFQLLQAPPFIINFAGDLKYGMQIHSEQEVLSFLNKLTKKVVHHTGGCSSWISNCQICICFEHLLVTVILSCVTHMIMCVFYPVNLLRKKKVLKHTPIIDSLF